MAAFSAGVLCQPGVLCVEVAFPRCTMKQIHRTHFVLVAGSMLQQYDAQERHHRYMSLQHRGVQPLNASSIEDSVLSTRR